MPSTSKPTPDDAAVPTVLTNKQRRKLSKREQALYSQEMVEVRRREARAKNIRRRVTLAASVLLAVGVVSSGTGLLVRNAILASEVGPANMLSDGILFTGSTDQTTQKATISPVSTEAIQANAKPVATNLKTYSSTANIVLYLDYASPKSAQFMKANGTALENWLGAGYITLEIHPIAPSSSTKNDYSARAANALACVAASDATQFLPASDALLAAASTKSESSLSNAAIVAAVQKAGVTDTKVPGCITGSNYTNWVGAATHRATHGGVLNSKTKTVKTAPLVLVNETAYTGKLTDNTAFTTFISNLYADSQSSTAAGTATATPTPSATPAP
jgi:hypothetical protein